MRLAKKHGIFALVFLIILLPLLVACGGGDGGNDPVDETPTESDEKATSDLQEDVKIVIGNITDITGVSANALSVIDMALEDMVEYFNEENLIPGVELKVETYDGQWDPARYIPGYEWLRNRGADLIWTPAPPALETLKPRANEDEFVIFGATANWKQEELNQGGYVFSLGITPEYEAYTLLNWIAENDPNFPQDRPAKIGGASWLDGYSNIWYTAAENYADAHPDQFEWVEGYENNFLFIWDVEAEGLKNCDYVFLPTPMNKFVETYTDAGHTAAFVGSDVQAAFLGMIDQTEQWDEIDGMFFTRSSRWYNEESVIADLTNKVLNEKHPGDAEEIRRTGSGYISSQQIYFMLDIIRQAVEAVGPDNFDSQALYNAATSFSYTLDGVENFSSFDETKRYAQNYYGIYEARADGENLFRADPVWREQIFVP